MRSVWPVCLQKCLPVGDPHPLLKQPIQTHQPRPDGSNVTPPSARNRPPGAPHGPGGFPLNPLSPIRLWGCVGVSLEAVCSQPIDLSATHIQSITQQPCQASESAGATDPCLNNPCRGDTEHPFCMPTVRFCVTTPCPQVSRSLGWRCLPQLFRCLFLSL